MPFDFDLRRRFWLLFWTFLRNNATLCWLCSSIYRKSWYLGPQELALTRRRLFLVHFWIFATFILFLIIVLAIYILLSKFGVPFPASYLIEIVLSPIHGIFLAKTGWKEISLRRTVSRSAPPLAESTLEFKIWTSLKGLILSIFREKVTVVNFGQIRRDSLNFALSCSRCHSGMLWAHVSRNRLYSVKKAWFGNFTRANISSWLFSSRHRKRLLWFAPLISWAHLSHSSPIVFGLI